VKHIKQQKYFHHIKDCGYNKDAVPVQEGNGVLIISTVLDVMKIFVIKQQFFFTFIFAFFLLNLIYDFGQMLPAISAA